MNHVDPLAAAACIFLLAMRAMAQLAVPTRLFVVVDWTGKC